MAWFATATSALKTVLKTAPYEVYPLLAGVGFVLSFGAYSSVRALSMPDVKIFTERSKLKDRWEERLPQLEGFEGEPVKQAKEGVTSPQE